MRVKMALYIGGFCIACQGCAPLGNAARTTLIEPLIYPRCLNDLLDCHRNREQAEAAWGSFDIKHPTTVYSSDFARGFKVGYSDYLYAGGTGAPPPVPPRCYWNST